jgi:hypothetical protein
MTLTLPAEPGLIPFGRYASWRTDTPQQVFVRSHSDLGAGFFLIEYTNAKSGRSRAYRTAVVQQGTMKVMGKSGSYHDTTTPTWVAVAFARSARISGEYAFRAQVMPENHGEYDYPWSSFIPGRSLEEVTRLMVALVRAIHGKSFDSGD